MTKGDQIIAISHFTADHIRTHYAPDEAKLTIIPRGVDLEYFNPASVTKQRLLQTAKALNIPEERPIILLPGRLTRWKGHGFLLEALKGLRKGSFVCVFLGDDKGHSEYRKELEERIHQYGLTEDVLIRGNISDMPAAYRLADIVVSASMEPEAFGRVAIEAQAMERLLIATNIGGSCETVKDNETGWLIPPGDVGALQAALERALAMPLQERERITSVARQHVSQHFSLELMCKKTLAVYEAALSHHSL